MPIVLALVDDHIRHLGRVVVDKLNTTVTAWVIGAGGGFSNQDARRRLVKA